MSERRVIHRSLRLLYGAPASGETLMQVEVPPGRYRLTNLAMTYAPASSATGTVKAGIKNGDDYTWIFDREHMFRGHSNVNRALDLPVQYGESIYFGIMGFSAATDYCECSYRLVEVD